MPFSTCPTIGDFLDLPSHKVTHDDIKGVVDAHTAALGDNVGLLAGHATLEARVLAQATTPVLSTVRGTTTVGRAVFETNTGAIARHVDPVVYGGTGAAFWRYEASPKLVIDHVNGWVGVNRAPLVPFHVSLDGATGEPAVGASEVARFVRMGATGRHASVSIIGDRTASSRLYLGDQDSAGSGEIRHDHVDNSLRFFSNDLQHMTMMGDGATIISRDSTTSLGPALEGATVMRLIRAHEPAAGAVLELTAGSAASATLRFGDTARVADGRIRYNNVDRSMQLWTAETLAMEIASGGRTHILTNGATVGTGYHGGTGLVVARAGGTSFMHITSQNLFASGLLLGTATTPELARLSYDAGDRTLLLNIEGNKVLKTTWNGTTELRGGGVSNDGIDITVSGGILAPTVYTFTSASAANVTVSTTGQMSRSTSARKYKTDIQDLPYEDAERVVLGLRPVTFRSKLPDDDPSRVYVRAIADDIVKLDERLGIYEADADDGGKSVWQNPNTREVENFDQAAVGLLACTVIQRHHGQLADLADVSLAHLTAIAQLAERVTALEAV